MLSNINRENRESGTNSKNWTILNLCTVTIRQSIWIATLCAKNYCLARRQGHLANFHGKDVLRATSVFKLTEKETTLSHQLKPLPQVSLLLGNHYFSGNLSTRLSFWSQVSVKKDNNKKYQRRLNYKLLWAKKKSTCTKQHTGKQHSGDWSVFLCIEKNSNNNFKNRRWIWNCHH